MLSCLCRTWSSDKAFFVFFGSMPAVVLNTSGIFLVSSLPNHCQVLAGSKDDRTSCRGSGFCVPCCEGKAVTLV